MKPQFIKVSVVIEVKEDAHDWDGEKMGVGSFETTMPSNTIHCLDLNGIKNTLVQDAANDAIEKGLIVVPGVAYPQPPAE